MMMDPVQFSANLPKSEFIKLLYTFLQNNGSICMLDRRVSLHNCHCEHEKSSTKNICVLRRM